MIIFNFIKKKIKITNITKCYSCGKETGMFMISKWFFGLIKRVHCVECVYKKLAKKHGDKSKYGN